MTRLAEDKDLENILELYIDLHEDSVPEDSDKRRNVWANILNDKNYNIIVNEVDGMIVSSCTCIIVPNPPHVVCEFVEALQLLWEG